MAQSKGRIVIWSIVGLAVVVTAILLLTAERGGGKTFEVDDVPRFSRQMERRIHLLEEDVAQARGAYGAGEEETFALIEQSIAKSLEDLQKMQTMTDEQELATQKDITYDHYREARRLLKTLD
ncbi:MAG: hypothetical protein R6X14_04500 [bacterium]